MRKEFPSFYELDSHARNRLWKEGKIVFDASAVLTLTALAKEPRENAIGLLNAIKERLWIPHHAALEYTENRTNRITRTVKNLDDWQDGLTTDLAKLHERLKGANAAERGAQAEIDKLFNVLASLDEVIPEVQSRLDEYREFIENDETIFEAIDALFLDRIGPAFNQNRLAEIIIQGEIRYRELVPPGYKDQTKDRSGDPRRMHNGTSYDRKYGDLIIWMQIIEKISENENPTKSIIFVTDDTKEDWWERKNGKRAGPRRELREEISGAGAEYFWMYSLSGFLASASRELGLELNNATITAAKEAAEAPSEKHSQETRTAPSWVSELEDFANVVWMDNEKLYHSAMALVNQLRLFVSAWIKAKDLLRRVDKQEISSSSEMVISRSEMEAAYVRIYLNEFRKPVQNLASELSSRLRSTTEWWDPSLIHKNYSGIAGIETAATELENAANKLWATMR